MVRPGLSAGVPAIWLLFGIVAIEILATYSRLPAAELYHVSGSGLEGGLGRDLVFLNFPLALAAIAILGVLFERLAHSALKALAAVAAVLCAAVFWPGVVDQADLDARPVNAIAAVGVALALALTAVAGRPGVPAAPRGGHAARLGIVLAIGGLLVVASPWIAADLGFYLTGVPVLGDLFQTQTASHPLAADLPSLVAVHHGHHHGMDGVLLVLSALLLSRPRRQIRTRVLRSVVSAYLALMTCYGIGNIANDFWLEQVVKRGWTSWRVPNVLEPRPTIAWAIIVGSAAALWARQREPVRN